MGDAQLMQWFNTIDVDRSGQLDARELQRALEMGNLRFGLNDVDAMICAFDTNRKRALDFREFSGLHWFLVNVQNSFQQFDFDRSGSLSLSEVTSALRQAGFHMDQPAIVAMLSKFDPDNSNTLSLDEYIRACLFLQTAVKTFSAFDQHRTGSITLTFNQFVYACSYVSG